MAKNSVKIIAAVLTAVLALTGCSERERIRGESSSESVTSIVINVSIDTDDGGESNSSADSEESGSVESSVSSTTEDEETSSTSSSSASSSTSTSSSSATSSSSSSTATSSSKVSSSSEETSSTPVSSSSSSSTATSSDNDTSSDIPVIDHNCETDGHTWEITKITSEPKMCSEMHLVYDNGFDGTLASRYYGLSMGEAYQIFLESMEALGVSGESGSATVAVEVWGTETYEVKTCSVCGEVVADSDNITVEPIGEWQFSGGKNLRWEGCDILFYDPYNIPQAAIDSINRYLGNI